MSVLTQKATLRYRNAVAVPSAGSSEEIPASAAMVAAFLRNVETIGFSFDSEAVSRFSKLPAVVFQYFAVEIISALKEIKGANFNYAPMYPNFPNQVASASDAELFINAISHYFGDAIGVRITPDYEKEERFPFYDETSTVVLKAVDASEFPGILSNLLSSKVSFSDTDVELFNHLVTLTSANVFREIAPEVIPNKENLAYAAAAVRGNKEATEVIFKKAKTATDVLRIIAVYSNSHPSLGEKFRVSSLRRFERRLIVDALNRMSGLNEEFKKNREPWKRVAESIHFNEYTLSAELSDAVNYIRSSRNIPSWGTAVESAFDAGDVKKAVDLLSQRPGYFARRLNQLFETAASDEQEYIVSEFRKVAKEVSTSVLWQAVAFFRTLQVNPARKYSTLFTKGVSRPAYALERSTTHIPADIIEEIITVAVDAVESIYSEKEDLGKVYLETDGYNPVIPFGLRNTSNAFRVVGRGSTMKFDVEKTLRFFTYWKDQPDARVDLDLSAVTLDENFKYLSAVTYYNLRENGALHSGDITSAPHGASEFIDIPVKQYLKKSEKARYVVMTVHSYTHQRFNELNEVTAGFMVRENAGSGEIYEPASVQNAFVINSASTNVAPLVFDLVTGEAHWVDLPLQGGFYVNNVQETSNDICAAIEGIVSREHVTVKDVVEANIKARGVLVDTAEEADNVVRVTAEEVTVGFDELISKWL